MSFFSSCVTVKPGDQLPQVVIHDGMAFPPAMVNVTEACKGKKVRFGVLCLGARVGREVERVN